jgi:hypothetical protein
MLDTTDVGLGESLQLSGAGRGGGTVTCGNEGTGRDIEAAPVYEGTGELVDDVRLLFVLGSSIACSLLAVEVGL